MADSMIQSGRDIASRYSTYATTGDRDIYTNPADVEKENALYKDKGTLSFTDMLGLMVTQFQNQTIDNQASTTDMMNQLVQMTTMQAMTDMTTQIKELTLANVMSYAASLVGQTVTIGVERGDQAAGGLRGRGKGHRHLQRPAGYLCKRQELLPERHHGRGQAAPQGGGEARRR